MAITEPDLCVATVPIFQDLPRAQQAQIETLVRHEHIAKDASLYLEGDVADALYILHAGQVKISRTSAEGRTQLLQLLGPGDFDGDVGLLMAQHHAATAQATTPVTACVLYKADFQQLLASTPAIASAVIAALAARIQQLQTQTTLVTTASVGERLQHYLLQQYQTFGTTFVLNMKKKDLADYLGTTPETLSRKLTLFEDNGWLEQARGRRIKILDPEALREA